MDGLDGSDSSMPGLGAGVARGAVAVRRRTAFLQGRAGLPPERPQGTVVTGRLASCAASCEAPPGLPRLRPRARARLSQARLAAAVDAGPNVMKAAAGRAPASTPNGGYRVMPTPSTAVHDVNRRTAPVPTDSLGIRGGGAGMARRYPRRWGPTAWLRRQSRRNPLDVSRSYPSTLTA